MKKLENKSTNFWPKFLARAIDFVILSVIIVSSGFLLMKKTENSFVFKQPLFFYLWTVIVIIVLTLWFIVIPIFWKGKTLGMWIIRIRIISTINNLKLSIVKRETFFTFVWILNILLLMSVINHTLVNNYIKFLTSKSVNKFSFMDNFRISFVVTIGSFTALIQMISIIISIIRKDKLGLHDFFAKTKVVWINKKVNSVELQKGHRIKLSKPKKLKKINIEWNR